MSSLLTSRWATGSPEEQTEKPVSVESPVVEETATTTDEKAAQPDQETAPVVVVETEVGVAAEGADEGAAAEGVAAKGGVTREQSAAEEDQPQAEPEEKTFHGETGEDEPRASATPTIEVVADIVEPKDEAPVGAPTPVEPNDEAATSAPPPVEPFRLEPPRIKRTVSWRSKKVVVNILNLDYAAFGLPVPLSNEEVQQRLQKFEDEGYDTANTYGTDGIEMGNKPIWPEEVDAAEWHRNNRPAIMLPNLNTWRDYMNALTEAKLAALGVSLGNDEPPAAQDMSRQSSGPFARAFSPPVPTGSALSMGRPGFVRGHSHTMSVAPPISPMNGPFGHMHRHSTFHGLTPMQAQELARQATLSGLRSFSPQPQLPQIASPLHALRNDIGVFRGPGSPLSHSMTPDFIQDFNRLRQAGFIPQPPVTPNALQSQRAAAEPIPMLPELPEDEDEEELSDPTPHAPPQKRSHVNEEIAIPTPRGHRHNISEGLEREVMSTEQRREDGARKTNGHVNGFGQAPQLFGQVSDQVPREKDPLNGDFSVQPGSHGHKKSASRFNVAAPAFTYNPATTFQPGSAAFNLPAAAAAAAVSAPASAKHTRQASSGNFNVAAPEFKPSGQFSLSSSITEETRLAPDMSRSEFGFSSAGPTFKPGAPVFRLATPAEPTIVDRLPSIFGKINIPEMIKPAKKSRAVSIVSPGDSSHISSSNTDVEDESGRIGRSDERPKRSRVEGQTDGDEVPRFAEPTPVPTQPAGQHSRFDKSLPKLPDEIDGSEEKETDDGESVLEPKPKHQLSSSLSALAKPWQPVHDEDEAAEAPAESPSASSLEDGEIDESAPGAAFTFPAPPHRAASSFAEIDAVMQQLNAGDESEPERAISPTPDTYDPQPGVTYISTWPRSDAPSPSPQRQIPAHSPPPFDQPNGKPLNGNGWPHINRLNKAQGPPSDWSDMLSPEDDHKLQARSSFFDEHVDDVIGRVLAERLRPFEDTLRNVQLTLTKHASPLGKPPIQRSLSAIESDADDEDDSDAQLHRPVSRGRDQKLGHIKAIVLEALREQSPQRQTSYDIAELHSALADMKVSFARVASTSLELDDIRAVVDDVVGRQSQALVPVTAAREPPEEHRRQITALQDRLDETLTSSLEQANRIHAVEQREAEARRMLKLAEEEIRLLRDTNRDDDSRVIALEEEHNRLMEQLEEAEDARSNAEAQQDSMKAETAALQATLEEYRLSSTKWRHEVEEHKVARQGLQHNVANLERQIADTQDSGSSMRRRLEKLHGDLATAMGQFTSEKGRWQSREESYRTQRDVLESQTAVLAREKQQLQEEIIILRNKASEVDAAKQASETLRTSNASFDDTISGLRNELAEQKNLTSQFERESTEAKEASRIEIQRMRNTMELDVEAGNHRASLVRAELENEAMRARTELDHVKLEADTAKAKHALMLKADTDAHREALEKLSQTHNEALAAAHLKHEASARDLTQQHSRSLAHAIEDKDRSEYILNERLALADAKLQHFQDKVLHLEERVEVAKSAAQAAVIKAQSSRPASQTSGRNGPPEKISPQALRESILVLQEQLQERESRIETLHHKLKLEGPATLKERDTEIAWLRELLTVRNEELTELINTLSKPTFDRDSVRDVAIRIRANLQMEQQEKERLGKGPDFPIQAIASLSSFATPKAAQLTSAFNKWRANMESSALKSRPSSRARTSTPPRVTSGSKTQYNISGLMTPPASNLRSSPSPESHTSLPAPSLSTRRPSQVKSINLSEVEHQSIEDSTVPNTPTLLGADNYDDDAEDRPTAVEDEDLDVADSQPPAFRSLADELPELASSGVEEL